VGLFGEHRIPERGISKNSAGYGVLMRLMSMKLRQCLFLVSGLLFVAPAIATAEKPSSAEGRHSEHRALEDDVRHRGIIVLDTVYKTTPAVRHEMIAALQIYESLAEA